jgi:hypothetical protein
MIHNGAGSSSLAKGLFVGIVVGAAAGLTYVLRSWKGFRSGNTLEGERFQRRNQPLSTASVEKNMETGRLAKRSIGWLVVFCFASAVAIISELKLNKIRPRSYDRTQ